MNLDNIAEARWVSDTNGQSVSGLTSDRVIYRKVTGINIKDISDLAETLRFRVSVKNPDNGEKYYSVTDPMVNGVVQEGIWRGITVKIVEGVHNPGQTPSPASTNSLVALATAKEVGR